jgi:hypothetical protein
MGYDNPHAVDADEDRIISPPEGVEGWSENINFCCHAGHGALGVYAHMSRMRDDPTVWESVLSIYLPDDELIVDRSFGRSRENNQASSGQLTFTSTVPLEHWSMRFDGMARRVPRTTAAEGLLRDGPVELVRLDLELVAASPVWSMTAALGAAANEQSWASMHLEQAMRVMGTVTLRDQVIEVDNIAFRDHSAGVRDYKSLTGEAWATCAFPSGRLLSAVQVLQASGYAAVAHGWMYDGEKMHDLHAVTLENLSGTLGQPQHVQLAYHGPSSDQRVGIELQHSMAFSLSEPIGMQLGADGRSGLFVVEGPARFSWDGEHALGWLERCTRVG